MEFDFDPVKSRINKQKHGIDFREAQKLWNDAYRIIIPAKNLDEPRYLLMGMLYDKIWSAIFTVRENKIRIISVRRARKNEKQIYEGRSL